MAVDGIDDADFIGLKDKVVRIFHHLRDAQGIVGELPGYVQAVTRSREEEYDAGAFLSGPFW